MRLSAPNHIKIGHIHNANGLKNDIFIPANKIHVRAGQLHRIKYLTRSIFGLTKEAPDSVLTLLIFRGKSFQPISHSQWSYVCETCGCKGELPKLLDDIKAIMQSSTLDLNSYLFEEQLKELTSLCRQLSPHITSEELYKRFQIGQIYNALFLITPARFNFILSSESFRDLLQVCPPRAECYRAIICELSALGNFAHINQNRAQAKDWAYRFHTLAALNPNAYLTALSELKSPASAFNITPSISALLPTRDQLQRKPITVTIDAAVDNEMELVAQILEHPDRLPRIPYHYQSFKLMNALADFLSKLTEEGREKILKKHLPITHSQGLGAFLRALFSVPRPRFESLVHSTEFKQFLAIAAPTPVLLDQLFKAGPFELPDFLDRFVALASRLNLPTESIPVDKLQSKMNLWAHLQEDTLPLTRLMENERLHKDENQPTHQKEAAYAT